MFVLSNKLGKCQLTANLQWYCRVTPTVLVAADVVTSPETQRKRLTLAAVVPTVAACIHARPSLAVATLRGSAER